MQCAFEPCKHSLAVAAHVHLQPAVARNAVDAFATTYARNGECRARLARQHHRLQRRRQCGHGVHRIRNAEVRPAVTTGAAVSDPPARAAQCRVHNPIVAGAINRDDRTRRRQCVLHQTFDAAKITQAFLTYGTRQHHLGRHGHRGVVQCAAQSQQRRQPTAVVTNARSFKSRADTRHHRRWIAEHRIEVRAAPDARRNFAVAALTPRDDISDVVHAHVAPTDRAKLSGHPRAACRLAAGWRGDTRHVALPVERA